MKQKRKVKIYAVPSQVKKAIVSICEGMGCKREDVFRLIRLTDMYGGVQYVSLKGYNSDKSLHTEVADHLINIGASYENMLNKDAMSLNDVVCSEVNVDGFNYNKIDLNGVSLSVFKEQVREQLPVALAKLKEPKKERETGDVSLNGVLVWNENTGRLSIRGMEVNKVVKTEGVFKKTKSKPLTVAGECIRYHIDSRTQTIRRFAVDNLNGMKMMGETLEIGGGQKAA